ncbi:uncharacterized protein LOC112505658 isoform X2 [Cynara cardunculus var. scolymus]|uniref:uncharacterized protein LOC112505658 isoform X2 n=1 Tax=Cynara cardunculus var. scolymus TaxID=59895 RepID=UPI000D627846|nr:uncharacterized protein LOC112505658 isoform X2 [Cynara cardunculus var. scolymus]
MGFSHIIRFRRPFSRNLHLHKTIFINQLIAKPFSSSTPTSDERNPKPTSLSARMSFVFDQIDAIEKERSQKDETLQRIRAWRESKKEKQPTIEQEESVNVAVSGVKEKGFLTKGVELVHPWPEWIELMERLVQQNYFDCRRKDEGKVISDSGFGDVDAGDGIMAEILEEGFDFTRDWKTVQTAGLNFGKDRFDILRSLSRQDIQLLVGYGCPSADKKVVFSAKLLRKHVHLDEGDVCSSCSLRSSCERAYLITNKEDEARTIDIMRVLMTYGFDPINGSVVNDSLLKKKPVKTAVRKLLHEVVKLSGIPIDPNLPPPIIKRPPPKVKQTPPPPKKRVGRDDVEMKKGDWLCPKCDFMNFAKNTVCLQCDAKRPKRQLLPGEWECPECKFLNYRRNMACFECECKRPPDEFTENQMQERQRGPRTRLDNVPSRKEVSDAWNFDFDENESDGAEVAAFEYADSRKLDEDFPSTRQRDEERYEDNTFHNRRPVRPQETEYSASGPTRPGVGFDDFDDEEEDDVNSYELDTNQNQNRIPKSSSVNFSDLDVDSESEDDEPTNEIWNDRRPVSSRSVRASSKPLSRKSAFSEDDGVDFNSDDDLPVHPNWKSSHVADYRQKSRSRMGNKFGSDEDSDLSSGSEDLSDDDFPPKHKGRRNSNRKAKDEFEFFDEGKDRSRRKNAIPDRRKSPARGFNRNDSYEVDSNRRSNKGQGSGAYDRHRNGSYEGGTHDFKSHRRDNFGDKQNRRSNNVRGSSGTGTSAGGDSYLDDERFRRPRVNVR